MREMKDSGVAWIGVIPKDWYTCKAKFLMKSPVRTGAGAEAIQYNSAEIRYIRITDFDKFGKIDDSKKVSLPKSIGEKYLLNNGDILIATAGGTVGKSMIFSDIGEPCAYAGYLAKYDINEEKLNRYFFLYFLQSPLFANYRNGMLLKSTIENISASKYANMDTIVPLRDEQEKIVNYLRKKCSQIDTLISNQQQQIEKLKAYKQSVITETVTKGLDPDVQMKDSGVEWIGEIPEHWTVAPIRSLFRIKKDIIGHEPDTVLSITQGGIKVKDINENSGQMANSYAHYQIVNIGDFAMNHMDLLTGGVGISEFEGVTSPDYRVFVIRNAEMNPRYFFYVFQMYYRNKIFYAFGQGAANLGRWRLPAQNFNTVAVPLSPVDEQNSIVTFLDEKCSQIDKLIALKQQKIEKLQQYKKSLIYEYVTGKKEITA